MNFEIDMSFLVYDHHILVLNKQTIAGQRSVSRASLKLDCLCKALQNSFHRTLCRYVHFKFFNCLIVSPLPTLAVTSTTSILSHRSGLWMIKLSSDAWLQVCPLCRCRYKTDLRFNWKYYFSLLNSKTPTAIVQHAGFDTSLITLESHAVKNQDFRCGNVCPCRLHMISSVWLCLSNYPLVGIVRVIFIIMIF